MTTAPLYSSRYTNTNIKKLVDELQGQAKQHESLIMNKIHRDRKAHQSCCQMMERNKKRENPPFNNKTKVEGKLFQQKIKSVPYMFLPKYKHDNLIIPDRAFAKGKASQRFFIKMKDTSVYSFAMKQDDQTTKLLHKTQKEKTIVGRKLQEMERIIDQNDGKIKAQKNKWFLLTRKTFKPPSNYSDVFSRVDPMLETRQFESMDLKRKNLGRTMSRQNNLRSLAQTTNKFFSATAGTSFYTSTDVIKKRTFR